MVSKTGGLRIHLTGEVRIESGSNLIQGSQFPGRLGRLAFAYLVAERDRPVPREELAETLWSGEPPPSWEKGTAVLMSKLRSLLGRIEADNGDVLSYAYGCYQLHLPQGAWVDVWVAARSAEAAEAALAGHDDEAAVEQAAAALSLTRGEFLPGQSGDWVQQRRDDVRRLRVRSLDCLAEARLALGNPRLAVDALKEMVVLEPFRESGYALLMRAHAAAGDRAEALRVHEACRKLLSEELGVDPSPETEAVHLEILRSKPLAAGRADSVTPDPTPPTNDASPIALVEQPAVTVPSPSPRPARRLFSYPRAVMAARALVVVVGALTIGMVLLGPAGGSTPRAAIVPGVDAVARLTASSGVFTLNAAVGQRPTGVAVTDQRVWVINYTSQTLSWLDPVSGAILGTRAVGGPPTGLVAGGGAIWVTAQYGLTNGAGGSVLRFDPMTGQPSAPIPVGYGVDGVAYGGGAVWVTNAVDDSVMRIDALTGVVGAPISVGREPVAIAIGAGSVWVADQLDSTVDRINEQTGTVTATIRVASPSAIATDAHSVWVVSSVNGSVTRLDPATNDVVTTISVGSEPTAVSVEGKFAWVAVGGARSIVRVDEAGNRLVASTSVQGHPADVDSYGGGVWVTIDG